MRMAYLDCFAGISGDMFLGALLDVGVPAEVLLGATKALGVGASLKIERVDRSGISCMKVDVLEGGRVAEEGAQGLAHSLPHLRERDAQDDGGRAVPVEHQSGREDAVKRLQAKTQHLQKAGHVHSHEHSHEKGHVHAAHGHGRSLTQIRALIQEASLQREVKEMAIRAFELLGRSEAKIHNVPMDEIHFHEVGAVDAIVDIVAASAGIHWLGVDAWHCSAVNVGGGVVECAHGTFPVPAPAAADLLRGFPTYSAHVQKELVTPTGAALLRVLNPTFGTQPAMRVERIGYGAGTRNPEGFPNVLRISVGEAFEDESAGIGKEDREVVAVLETALDDLSPQVIAYVAEAALAEGALDVMLTPVVMKKGRPGTMLTVLCDPALAEAMERLLLRETSTLGVRIRHDKRRCLERRHVAVATEYGEVRMKVGSLGDEELNAAPEFEDCRAAAARHQVPLKRVQQAAIGAYWMMTREQVGGLP